MSRLTCKDAAGASFYAQAPRGTRVSSFSFPSVMPDIPNHRDCNANNVMMDPTDLYPNSYHPVATDLNRNYIGKAQHFTRTQKSPKYYFVDFGNSHRYEPGTDLKAPQEPLPYSGDKTVPEYKGVEPYSPFATDVYLVGNLIREHFLEV